MKCLLIAVSCIFLNFHQVLCRASAPVYVANENEFANYKIDDFVDQEIEESGLRLLTNSSNFDESSDEDTNIPEGRVYYNGSQLWKVEVNNPDAVTLITNFEKQKDISMWGGNATHVDVLVSAKALDKVRETFKENDIKYVLVIDDVQRAIDEENPTDLELDDRRGHRLTWQAYHRSSDINGYLDYLALTYPDLCTVQTIGSSVQGKPIKVLKISNGKSGNKAVWVDGGIHAREWITPASVTYMINQIVSHFESQPEFIQNLDWYFAPLLNPDGYEYTHTVDRLWRKNRARGNGGRCAGTDLNRNFGYRWGGQGSSKNPCTETFGGTGPFSEPETAAVERFIRGVSGSSANWKAYVSFHSYGQYILYPWGYDRVVPPDYKDLEVVAKKAAAAIVAAGGPRYTTGPAGGTLYPASGGSDDWAKGTMKFKYAYTIELRDSGRYGFVLPASYIQPTAREAFAALKVIAQAAAAAWHRLTWQAYHRSSDINGYLDYLALTYPDLCTVQTIGSSVQGNPIKVLKISNGKSGNKAVWVDGGIHAREWITPASVTYMINQIVSHFESQPEFIQNLDWYFAPLLNPDGYEYTHTVDRLWRKNRARGNGGRCAGTDLNRNFGYRWGGQGSSKNPCTETFGGTGPFSEPETAAVERFIRGVSGSSANWKAYVSFHSYGQYILYPWGYDRVVPPDYKDLEVVAKKAAAAIVAAGGPRYTTGPAGGTLYPASGGSDDWAKGTMKFKYAYTIELRDSGRYGFVLPASYIQPTAREAFAALKVIAQAAAAA